MGVGGIDSVVSSTFTVFRLHATRISGGGNIIMEPPSGISNNRHLGDLSFSSISCVIARVFC